MKLAVLSDIHGNHVALERCLHYIEQQGVDAYLLLGDYIGEFPYPQKTMQLLYELQHTKQCYLISGNKESYWIQYKNSGEQGWSDYNSVTGSLLYSYRNLTEQDIHFLSNLPEAMTVNYQGLPPLELIHIPPYKELNTSQIHEESLKDSDVKGPLILCGHRHIQGQMDYNGKTYINPGSVGISLYANSTAQFALLNDSEGFWQIDYISLEYDINQVIQEIHEEKLDQLAPCWTAMTIRILKGSLLSHAAGLSRAMEITSEKYGECIWPDIPEECFEQAVTELFNT